MCPDGQSADGGDSNDLFAQMFGVTTEQLKSQGINPAEYISTHLHDAMKDPAKRALVLSQSAQLRWNWLAMVEHAYLLVFAGFGALILAALLHGAGRVAALVVAFAIVAVVFTRSIAAHRVRRSLGATARDEGVNPWGRPGGSGPA